MYLQFFAMSGVWRCRCADHIVICRPVSWSGLRSWFCRPSGGPGEAGSKRLKGRRCATSSPNIGVNSGSADPALKPNATTAMTQITRFTNASRSHASSRISSSALIAAGHGRPHSCHEHFPRTPHHCRESRALMSMWEIRMPAAFSYAGRSRSTTNVWIVAGHLTQRTGVR
jgi:hypothetical protein